MSILRKLKSLLGAGDADEEAERDVTVTVEHDPENEAAVKGAEVEDTGAEPEEEAGVDDETDDVSADVETDEVSADDETDDESVDDDADEPVQIPDAEGGTADAEADVDEDAEAEGEADADADADTGDAAASGADEPVDVLNGIGPAYAERLENVGIETVGELAAADAATLAEDADIAEGRIQGWIDQATEY